MDFYSSCPCYARQIVVINRSQLIWLRTSVVAWVRAIFFGISKCWIPLNYQIISHWVSKETKLPHGWVWIYLRRLNIKETQRFTVRNHTVLLYLVPTSQEVSVKARANQMQMWERQIKASSLTFIYEFRRFIAIFQRLYWWLCEPTEACFIQHLLCTRHVNISFY